MEKSLKNGLCVSVACRSETASVRPDQHELERAPVALEARGAIVRLGSAQVIGDVLLLEIRHTPALEIVEGLLVYPRAVMKPLLVYRGGR